MRYSYERTGRFRDSRKQAIEGQRSSPSHATLPACARRSRRAPRPLPAAARQPRDLAHGRASRCHQFGIELGQPRDAAEHAPRRARSSPSRPGDRARVGHLREHGRRTPRSSRPTFTTSSLDKLRSTCAASEPFRPVLPHVLVPASSRPLRRLAMRPRRSRAATHRTPRGRRPRRTRSATAGVAAASRWRARTHRSMPWNATLSGTPWLAQPRTVSKAGPTIRTRCPPFLRQRYDSICAAVVREFFHAGSHHARGDGPRSSADPEA